MTPGRRQPNWFGRTAAALLLSLGGAAPAIAFEEAEVRAIVGNVKTSEEYPGFGGIWMARQRIVEVNGVGHATVTEHLLARVFDPVWGRQRFSPYQRTYWSEYTSLTVRRARVWKSRDQFDELPPDSIREKISPRTEGVASYAPLRDVSIDFPRLSAGDVVELHLAWTCRVAHGERNARWSEEAFGAEEPVVEQQLLWITPTAAQIDTGIVGPPVPGEISFFEGFRAVRWLTGNLPPLRARFLESPWSRILVSAEPTGPRASSASVAMLNAWPAAGRIYGEMWEDAWTRRSSEIDRLASEASGMSAEPAARARALERIVRTRIRTLDIPDALLTLRPFPASQVALERAGGTRDKTCLLVSLLRSAGIEAHPVLVRERGDSLLTRVASLAQLDRFLARARLASGETLWLDPIERTAPIPPGRALLFVGPGDPSDARREAGLVPFPGLPADPR